MACLKWVTQDKGDTCGDPATKIGWKNGKVAYMYNIV